MQISYCFCKNKALLLSVKNLICGIPGVSQQSASPDVHSNLRLFLPKITQNILYWFLWLSN